MPQKTDSKYSGTRESKKVRGNNKAPKCYGSSKSIRIKMELMKYKNVTV
jgi:hypothetical protein